MEDKKSPPPDSATIDAAGNLEVIRDEGQTRWSVPPLQIEKHLPQFIGGLNAGELSAARDAAADAAKELSKRRA